MKQFIIVLKDYPKSERFYLDASRTAKEHGWDLERYDAVDARTINFDQELKNRGLFVSEHTKKNILPGQIVENLRPGVIGCFLSHYSLWQRCIELNETIAIFEEDVVFVDSLPTEDFVDVLKLRQGTRAKNIVLTGQWWVGADCYLIKPHAARKIIDWCAVNGIVPADLLLAENIVNIQHVTKDCCRLHPEEHLNYPLNSLTWKKNKNLLS